MKVKTIWNNESILNFSQPACLLLMVLEIMQSYAVKYFISSQCFKEWSNIYAENTTGIQIKSNWIKWNLSWF